MVQVHVPQGVGVRVPPWAPDTKRRLREQPLFLLCTQAQHLRAVREGRERSGMQAGPGSRDVTETSVGTKYKKEVAKAASFFYGCTRAQHLRALPHLFG